MKDSHPRPADWCPFVLKQSMSQVTSFMQLGMLCDAWLAYSEQCPGWRTLRRQPRNSDLILGIGFQWSDKDSSLGWLSYLKKSLMSATGRAFRVNDILVMSTAFTLADSSFLATFFRPTGDLLLKVCQPTLGMTTAMGLKPFSICMEQILWTKFGQ